MDLRLIRYEIDGVSYFLGTTITDKEKYPRDRFQELYGERWGIEGLYKISKQLISIEEFHAKSTRGVKQEIYAHLTLITLNRLFTNHADDHPDRKGKSTPNRGASKIARNFKNSMAAVARNLESLLLGQAHELKETLMAVAGSISRRYQKTRPGRSYQRRSLQPKSKWQNFKAPASEGGAPKAA